MESDPPNKMLIRLAWLQGVVFVLIGAVATCFRGLQPEVVLGWIALIVLTLLSLSTVYGMSKRVQATGAFVLAALFLVALALRRDSWVVAQSELQDMAIGAVSLAAWLLAVDARTREPTRLVGHIAGALTAVIMLTLGGMLFSTDPSQAHALKVILVATILAALYDLSGPKWKTPLAILAGAVIVVVLIKMAPRFQGRPNTHMNPPGGAERGS